MEVEYDREKNILIYDRKLKNGSGNTMYGLEVCKSLNLPNDFLNRAHDIRMKYNNSFSFLIIYHLYFYHFNHNHSTLIFIFQLIN